MSIYRRVLAYYRPFSVQTAIGLILSLAAIGLSLLKPWPFKIIVDDVLQRNPQARFGNSPSLIPLLCLALVVPAVLRSGPGTVATETPGDRGRDNRTRAAGPLSRG